MEIKRHKRLENGLQSMSSENKAFQLNVMKHKKAQFKIQEMSFMLLALVLFFVIAALFFLLVSNANLKQSYEDLSKGKALTSISRLSSGAELNYGEQLTIDMDKLVVIKKNPNFQDYWEVPGGLVIERVYPFLEEDKECNLANYQSCNTFTLKQVQGNYEKVSSFVALCRKETKSGYSYDKCEIGVASAYIEQI